MKQTLKIADIGKECVGCGCCVLVCPKKAIHIKSGVLACVSEERCIGCGKCAKECPAAVITITKRAVAV